MRIQDSERSERIFDASSLLYPAKYFAARDCAPGPSTLATALLPSSFRNKDLQAALAQFAEIAADLKRDYFAAGFFSSTSMRSIGPVPMFSGRCAPAGVKTASPFLPDISSLLPPG